MFRFTVRRLFSCLISLSYWFNLVSLMVKGGYFDGAGLFLVWGRFGLALVICGERGSGFFLESKWRATG